jgi:hypothetical protein
VVLGTLQEIGGRSPSFLPTWWQAGGSYAYDTMKVKITMIGSG